MCAARWEEAERGCRLGGSTQNAAELHTVTPTSPTHVLEAVERRERERGRERVETEGTRGESLREWAKEREWCGLVLQKQGTSSRCQQQQEL
ncbi:unnamed protein product [Pylaiella littoralis]